MKKPPECLACPFYGTGNGFVPDRYVPGSPVCLVGQNPGEDEEKGQRLLAYRGKERLYEPATPQPFIGPTGLDLARKWLPFAGLSPETVSYANTIRCRVGGKNTLPSLESKELRQAIVHCQRHFKPPAETRVFMALGEYALWGLTGEAGAEKDSGEAGHGVSSWRGWLLPYNPPPLKARLHTEVYTPKPSDRSVFVTWHPASVYREPWNALELRADFAKLKRVLAGTWPRPLPFLEPTLPMLWPPLSAFDTEWYRYDEDQELVRCSLAYREGEKTRLRVVEKDDIGLVHTGDKTTVIFHNTEADYTHLSSILGHQRFSIEDTMYLHACVAPESEHNLNYVGSLYQSFNRHKHLADLNKRAYAGGDALATLEAWEVMQQELVRDPQVAHVYRNFRLPLIPIILKSRQAGIRVNQAAVPGIIETLEAEKLQLARKAQAVSGWPLLLSSPQQVGKMLFDVERLHLNPQTGNPIRVSRYGDG